jgi:UDP-N-acetylenolpyruvoylglucosamine reductase
MTLDNSFLKKFGGSLNKNVNLSNYSWFNLGGIADYLYKAKNKKQLLEFLLEAKKKKFKNNIFRSWI